VIQTILIWPNLFEQMGFRSAHFRGALARRLFTARGRTYDKVATPISLEVRPVQRIALDLDVRR